MAEGVWVVQEVGISGSTLFLRVPHVPQVKPVPGQYFKVYAPGFQEPISQSLFLYSNCGSTWELTDSIPPYWQPGTQLYWRGPFGHGFGLPSSSRRTAFLPWKSQGLPLQPVVLQALAQQAAVVWYADSILADLSSSVEVLPTEMLPEVWNWADYLAIICTFSELGEIYPALGIQPHQPLKCLTEILIQTSMLCGGVGECGLCAVKAATGWKLACKDGPVFDLSQLEPT